MTSSDKTFNPLAPMSPPSSIPSPGDLKQDEMSYFDKMAGSLIEDPNFGKK